MYLGAPKLCPPRWPFDCQTVGQNFLGDDCRMPQVHAGVRCAWGETVGRTSTSLAVRDRRHHHDGGLVDNDRLMAGPAPVPVLHAER